MTPPRSVIIVGAGPAGLTAARVLVEAGLRDVAVLERNGEAGGLPRFCAHPGWGMLDLHRIWTGPRYARELVRRAAGATLMTGTTVTALDADGRLQIERAEGPDTMQSRVVLLATGIRELPRGPRLVSGTRPWGVTTTGAFQDMVQSGLRPFRCPVIIGTELVAFSALLTARHAGIRPVALIEPGPRTVARRPAATVARHGFGVPVLTDTELVAIEGHPRVDAVTVRHHHGTTRRIPCDGVIFTGRFVPESVLARAAGLSIDPGTGGPAIDTAFRCSDPACFAAGNLLRPVEHSGIAAREGAAAAARILDALHGRLPDASPSIPVIAAGAIRYVYPQRIVSDGTPVRLFARATHRQRGWLRVLAETGRPLLERRLTAAPERRIRILLPPARLQNRTALTVTLDGAAA